jgi:H+/gluconate symporter-like permease
MGLFGILLGLGLLMLLAFRGWSILLLAPAAALLAAATVGEPLLAHWTQTFMGSAARFLAQFFPLFLLGRCSASSWRTVARSRRSPIS